MTTWCGILKSMARRARSFTRTQVTGNLLWAGLLMEDDLVVNADQPPELRYGFVVLDEDPPVKVIAALYDALCG